MATKGGQASQAGPEGESDFFARQASILIKAGFLGLFLLVLGLVLAAIYFGADYTFSPQEVEETIRSWGAWGILASIGLMVLHSFVPFPAEFLAIANGMVYGLLLGTVITWIGAMLGALLAFGLTRTLGRPLIEMLVARKNWHILDEWTAHRGGRIVLVSRFIPLIAFNLVNYAAGLMRISWWTFTWATGIGILPFTILMVAMGDFTGVLAWEAWALLGVAGLILWFLLRRRFLPTRKAPDGQLTD